MTVRIDVGNLPYQTTEDETRQLLGRHAAVESVSLITDRETGRHRGFGFVEMAAVARRLSPPFIATTLEAER